MEVSLYMPHLDVVTLFLSFIFISSERLSSFWKIKDVPCPHIIQIELPKGELDNEI